MSYLISLNPILLKNKAHVGCSKHFVLVYLRICVVVYLCLSHLLQRNVIFDFETRSRFFIIESRSLRRDREFSSLNLEIRDEIEMLFISFVNKFQTPEQRTENDISLKKMCIQR